MKLVALGSAALLALAAAAPPEKAVPPAKPDPTPPNERGNLLPFVTADRAKLAPGLKDKLAKLDKAKVPTAKDAEKVALEARFKAGGVLAEEGWGAVALYPLAGAVANFAAAGDLVWVVRFTHLNGGVLNEVWVSSTTGEVRSMLPLDIKPGKP